jgi:hypothetical protein
MKKNQIDILLLTLIFLGGIEFITYGLFWLKAIIVFLCLYLIKKYSFKEKFTAAKKLIFPYLLYLLYAFLSAIIFSKSITFSLLAIMPLTLGVIVYFYVATCNFYIKDVNKFKTLFVYITFLQIVFISIKYFTHGIDEKYLIGTMSQNAGQLGFLFPAIAIPVLTYSLYQNKPRVLYALIFSLYIFSVINEKRIAIYILPVVTLLSLLKTARNQLKKSDITFLVVSTISLIYLSINLIPSFHQASTYAAPTNATNINDNINFLSSFLNIIYSIFKYSIDYLVMDYDSTLQGSYTDAINNENIQVGRLIFTDSVIHWVFSGDLARFLFGNGFGSITNSSWLHKETDLIFPLIGTRGALSGLTSTLLETGTLGLALQIWFWVKLFYETITLRMNSNNAFSFRFIFYIPFCIFLLDYIFYSLTLFRTLPINVLFFMLLGALTHLSVKKSA